jgi:hypothetical protein
MSWPPGDIFRLDRGDIPDAPEYLIPTGTSLWHGTARDFATLKEMSWFTTSKGAAEYYAQHEAVGDRPRVLHLRTTEPLRLLWWPSVRDREQYANALWWAKEIFGVSFSEIGFRRVPEAFAIVCEDFDGIYIEEEDSGHTAIMVCDPSELITRNPGLGDPQKTLFGSEERRYVPMEELTREQILALPFDAFDEDEWDELDEDDQQDIVRGDPLSMKKADKVLEEILKPMYDWVAKPSDDDAFELAGEYFEQWLSEHDYEGDDGVFAAGGEAAEDVLEAYPRHSAGQVRAALNEAMGDTNNYDYSIEDFDYYTRCRFWCWTLDQQSVWLGEDEINTLAELPEAILAVALEDFHSYSSDALSHTLTVDAIDKAWRTKYPSFEAYIDTGKAVVVTPDWDKITADVEAILKDQPKQEFVSLADEENVVHTFDDDFFVKDLLAEELPAEGAEMRMCVGRRDMGYMDAVRRGATKIFSLRTPKGRPKLTFEVSLNRQGEPRRVVQVKGKANRLPGWGPRPGEGKFKVDEARKAVEFVASLGIDPDDVSDLKPALEGLRGRELKNPVQYRTRDHCGFCCPVGEQKGK